MRELKVGDRVRVQDCPTGINVKEGVIEKFCPCGCGFLFLKGYSEWMVAPEDVELIEETSQDAVNTPSHYLHGGIETIEVIRMMLTLEEFRGYCKGNIIKYRERAMFKGNADEDFAKALKYKEFMEAAE